MIEWVDRVSEMMPLFGDPKTKKHAWVLVAFTATVTWFVVNLTYNNKFDRLELQVEETRRACDSDKAKQEFATSFRQEVWKKTKDTMRIIKEENIQKSTRISNLEQDLGLSKEKSQKDSLAIVEERRKLATAIRTGKLATDSLARGLLRPAFIKNATTNTSDADLAFARDSLARGLTRRSHVDKKPRVEYEDKGVGEIMELWKRSDALEKELKASGVLGMFKSNNTRDSLVMVYRAIKTRTNPTPAYIIGRLKKLDKKPASQN